MREFESAATFFCKACNQFTQFRIRAGKKNACIPCAKKKAKDYYDANTEQEKTRSKAYYAANAEVARQRSRDWRKNNRERARLYLIQWRSDNPKKVASYGKKTP